MARQITRPIRHPVATATLIDLIHGYASGTGADSKLREAVYDALRAVDRDRAISRKMVENFSHAPREERIRSFGEFVPGSLRDLEDSRLKHIFNPLPTTLLQDDVFPEPPPAFPERTQFTISFTGLYCRSRTGDRGVFGPSDEPYVITSAVHIDDSGENVVRTVLHPVGDPDHRYGDVDSCEWRSGPIAACWAGEENEVSLVAVAMEHDEGDAEAYRDEIQLIVAAAAAVAAYFDIRIGVVLQLFAADVIQWIIDSEDDEIGTDVVIVTPDWLRQGASNMSVQYLGRCRRAKSVGFLQYVIEETSMKTNLEYDFVSAHTDNGSYYITYIVTADQDPIDEPGYSDVILRSTHMSLNNTI